MFSILLWLESEGDIVLLVWLQLVSGQFESLDISSLLELESYWLVLGPQGQSWLVLGPAHAQSWLYLWQRSSQVRLMAPAPGPLSPGFGSLPPLGG